MMMGDNHVHRPVTDMLDPIQTMNVTQYDQTSIRTDSRESAHKASKDLEDRNSMIITEIKVN